MAVNKWCWEAHSWGIADALASVVVIDKLDPRYAFGLFMDSGKSSILQKLYFQWIHSLWKTNVTCRCCFIGANDSASPNLKSLSAVREIFALLLMTCGCDGLADILSECQTRCRIISCSFASGLCQIAVTLWVMHLLVLVLCMVRMGMGLSCLSRVPVMLFLLHVYCNDNCGWIDREWCHCHNALVKSVGLKCSWDLMTDFPEAKTWPDLILGQGLGGMLMIELDQSDEAIHWRVL